MYKHKKEPLNQRILKLLVKRIRLYPKQYTEAEYQQTGEELRRTENLRICQKSITMLEHFVSNSLHRKTTPKLWPSTGWDFLIFSYKVNHLWAVVLYICIIALLFKAFKNIFICKYKKPLACYYSLRSQQHASRCTEFMLIA